MRHTTPARIALLLLVAACGSGGDGDGTPPATGFLTVRNVADAVGEAPCSVQLRLERPSGESPRFFPLGACQTVTIELNPGEWNLFVQGDTACTGTTARTVQVASGGLTTDVPVDCDACSDCPGS